MTWSSFYEANDDHYQPAHFSSCIPGLACDDECWVCVFRDDDDKAFFMEYN